jgi:diaminopimelate epimerase
MRFVHEHRLSDAQVLNVETAAGRLVLHGEADGMVRVNMGVPEFEPERIPLMAEAKRVTYPIKVEGETYRIGALALGNPHAVLQVPSVQTAEVARLGPKIESHPAFPRQVNAGFMEVVSPEHIRLRVHERGAGETLACGSGACAAVVSGRLQELLAERVKVSLPGGDLDIRWAGDGEPVWMSGPATSVYEGTIEL